MPDVKQSNVASFSSFGQFSVSEAGDIADISLAEVGEAKGHGVYVDIKSLESAFKSLGGRAVKAFNNHSFNPAPSEVVGMFSGVHIDTEQGKLRAKQFSWLDSYKQHKAADYDTLNELANKHPESFGVSVTHSFDLVWVFSDGREQPAFEDWFYDRAAPEGVVRSMPSVRFKQIHSADFVSSPAANTDGLFSSQTSNRNENLNTEIIMLKNIHAAYGQDPALLAEAMQFAAQNETASFETVQQHVAAFKIKHESAQKDAEIADLKQQLSAKDSEIAQLSQKVEAMAGGQGTFSTGDAAKPEPTKPADDVLRAQYAEMPAGKERAEFRAKHSHIKNWKL